MKAEEKLLSGAQILLEALKEEGVEIIFGYPGGAVLNIYDALLDYEDTFRHIRPAHEQGGIHAADGYARSTGKVGVCLATSGPGATNLVTGIATAYMDSVPLVAITGNVALPFAGRDSFQEVDIVGITMPITKHNFFVKEVQELSSIVHRAFAIAREGRPGPVLIDIPKDVTAQKAFYKKGGVKKPSKKSEGLKQEDLARALSLIKEARRPLIYAGGGVIRANASEELLAFAEKIQAPVVNSLMGLGTFPSKHDLFCGLVGMHGTKAANLATANCDLLLAIGTRFSDRVTSNPQKFARQAKVLHLDIDPVEMNKNVPIALGLGGDIKETLKVLGQGINEMKQDWTREDWLVEIASWQNEQALRAKKQDKMKAQEIMEAINILTEGEAIIATEVGQNQIWAAQYYPYDKPRTFISSGGLGTMGYGLGASIGAQLGQPQKRVFNIAGDGSFAMNCNELATALQYDLPIIVVILNNGVLGMVRQWQDLFYERRFSQTCLASQTNLEKLAEAYGALALTIREREEIIPVLKEALEAKKTTVINCLIDKDEKVFPIVPPGASIDQLIEEEREE